MKQLAYVAAGIVIGLFIGMLIHNAYTQEHTSILPPEGQWVLYEDGSYEGCMKGHICEL